MLVVAAKMHTSVRDGWERKNRFQVRFENTSDRTITGLTGRIRVPSAGFAHGIRGQLEIAPGASENGVWELDPRTGLFFFPQRHRPAAEQGGMHRHAFRSALPLAFLTVLAGCSSPDGAAAEGTAQASTARPAGCERNLCDVEYDRCEANTTDRCSECNTQCSAMSYELVVQCLDTCMDICSSPAPSTCSSARESCVMSTRNAICTDGIDPNDLPTSPEWFWMFRSPSEAHQGVCSAQELTQFEKACLGKKSSTSACEAFTSAHRGCAKCIVTDVDAAAWGPIIVDGTGRSWVNSEGCIARVAGDEDCAEKIYEANSCLSGCNQASDGEACLEFARAHNCKHRLAAAESCSAELGVDTSPEYASCGGAATEATLDITMDVIGFFCGAP